MHFSFVLFSLFSALDVIASKVVLDDIEEYQFTTYTLSFAVVKTPTKCNFPMQIVTVVSTNVKNLDFVVLGLDL